MPEDPAQRERRSHGPRAPGTPAGPAEAGPGEDGSASSRLADLLRRFDRAFTRTFLAMAMAEDGTRELALEQLEGTPPAATEPTRTEPEERD